MVTDTFFDLQRFADDTLVSSSLNGGTFRWQKNINAGAVVNTFNNVGTTENPVYQLNTSGDGTGDATVPGEQISLQGTRAGYSVAFDATAADWETRIQGTNNVISEDTANSVPSYRLNGEMAVTVNRTGGRAFDETLNSSVTYVKASDLGTAANATAGNPVVTVSSANTDAITYTFEDAANIAIGLDTNDTAVFKDTFVDANNDGIDDDNILSADNITLGAAPRADAATIRSVSFRGGDASVTSNGTDVDIAVKEDVEVFVGADEYWEFDNKSTRDNAHVIVQNDTEVKAVSYTKTASLYSAAGVDNPVAVNGTPWEQITGDIATATVSVDASNNVTEAAAVRFDADGNASINNTFFNNTTGTVDPIVNGAVTVKGAAEKSAEFATITAAGVVANGASIQSNASIANNIKANLDAAGITGLEMDLADGVVTVSGDQSFDVKVNKDTFNVATTADSISFDVINVDNVATLSTNSHQRNNSLLNLYVNGNVLRAAVNREQAYTVAGGEAVYDTETVVAGGQYNVTINGAAVNIKNGAETLDDGYNLSSDGNKAGIDEAMLLKPNDAINVSGDSDGFTAIYDVPTANQIANNDVVTFTVNDAKISVHATDVDTDFITVVAGSDNQVTVQGIEGNAKVTVASGNTIYHFKNELDRNSVSAATSAEFTEVTLTAGGDVMTVPTAGRVDDLIDNDDMPRRDADEQKWAELATVGGSTVNGGPDDTVTTHHASVYEQFYNLVNSAAAGNSVAGYSDQNVDTPVEGETDVIDIKGESPLGTPATLGEAVHITLDGGTAVGAVPINIQNNESTNARDVTVDLTYGSQPSTVAVGTTGAVTASHNVKLSNAGTELQPSNGYLGSLASGQNVLAGGTGYNMLRHDGDSRATILGNSGHDTIRGDVNDIVSGGAEADVFYDISGYALDYNVAEGDIIIASRLANINEVTQANIRGTGNQIGFGNGVNDHNGTNLLTLGNINPTAAVHVKVATIDDDGNLMKGVRDVVLANGNGTVDAVAAGENGALIITDSTRDNGGIPQVHDIRGSAGRDTIQAGAYDIVNGGEGNDDIYIENGAGADGVMVVLTGGADSVTGWTFGFDRAKGATQLVAGAQVVGRVFEDRMYVSLVGGNGSISFNDTAALGNSDTATMHGQYDVLVDNLKYTMIRNGDARKGYAVVDSNDNIADFYMAEREGEVHFTGNVTDLIGVETQLKGMDIGFVDLSDTTENFHAIRMLDLQNNSKTMVYGSAERETVTVGGAAVLGANKFISLGGGNDVIYSGGDGNPSLASHAFFFGEGDGRDTIVSYNHYQGVNEDPDKQSADIVVLQSFAGVKTEVEATTGYTRVEFALNADTVANEYALIYEAPGTYDYDKNMYRVQITDTGSNGIAKIGYSTTDNPTGTGNLFTYDKEVSFYIGSSGESRDTLVINTVNENVNIRMDSTQDVNGDGTTEFYRGIGVLDASAAVYTNATLAGSAANNMIVAGGEGTNNFMWGGAGNNTLVGGAGNDFFMYYLGANNWVEGADSTAGGNNDIVLNYNDKQDVIYLGDVTIDQINAEAMAQAGGNYGITENAVTVSFKNGGSLTVNVTDQENVRFHFGNGDIYTASRETGGWKKEA